uniref:Uncharacterized protein n=1 Tax=Anguilla anguilla TaxID=7936 RepID=A0A0E9VY38_ANGAN
MSSQMNITSVSTHSL